VSEPRRYFCFGKCRAAQDARGGAAALSGDLTGARAIDANLQPLHKDLFVEGIPYPSSGRWPGWLIGNAIRLPLVELATAHHETVLRAMRAAELPLRTKLHELERVLMLIARVLW